MDEVKESRSIRKKLSHVSPVPSVLQIGIGKTEPTMTKLNKDSVKIPEHKSSPQH